MNLLSFIDLMNISNRKSAASALLTLSDTWISRNMSLNLNDKTGATDLLRDASTIWINDTQVITDKIEKCESDTSVIIIEESVPADEQRVEVVVTQLPGD